MERMEPNRGKADASRPPPPQQCKRKEEFDDQAWGKEQPRQIGMLGDQVEQPRSRSLCRIRVDADFPALPRTGKAGRIDFICSACQDVLTVGTIRLTFPFFPWSLSIPVAPLLTRRMAWSHRASRSLLKPVFKY